MLTKEERDRIVEEVKQAIQTHNGPIARDTVEAYARQLGKFIEEESDSLLAGEFDSSNPQLSTHLDTVSEHINTFSQIIEALLDFTRETALHREWTQLDDWLKGEIDGYEFPASITVHYVGGEGPRANVDRQVLYQCLTNVLNNACDAILEDGDSDNEKTSTITVSLQALPGAVQLSVVDTGAGISRENMDLIFKPLFSTKGFGTGLGLPLVRKLIELHGGKIEVASQVGVGTEVRMILPLDLALSGAPLHTPS